MLDVSALTSPPFLLIIGKSCTNPAAIGRCRTEITSVTAATDHHLLLPISSTLIILWQLNCLDLKTAIQQQNLNKLN